jgi:N-acetylmuramoyl-L-alanine amidase
MSKEKKQSQAQLRTLLADNLRTVFTVFLVGVVVATVFTAATPPGMLSGDFRNKLAEVIPIATTPTPEWPTPTPRPRPRIGIVVGHWGDDNDPGAVCPDGLTELSVNQNVATLVQQNLSGEGFDVDLLKEFDPSLNGYQGLALISIHADSCVYVNDQATGYKVAASLETPRPEKTARLTACLRNRYARETQLSLHHSVTADMSSYHAFDEINQDTPAVILETGFLNLDRQILTQQPEVIARGISDGVLCFIYNEDVSNE